MPYTKGLAERALNENLYRLKESKPDPQNFNVHVAMLQMAAMLEELIDRREEQDERLATIERTLGALRRRSRLRGQPAPAKTVS
jgi:hypothetical protein